MDLVSERVSGEQKTKILGQGDKIDWGTKRCVWEKTPTPSGYRKQLVRISGVCIVTVTHSNGDQQRHEVRIAETVVKDGNEYTFPR